MNKRTIITISAITVVAATMGVGGVATAAGGDDNDQPITGTALAAASEAALAHTGEGRVTETEIGDEDSYYEVEVTLDDVRQVDVQLDEDFHVVGSTADADNEAGDD